MSTSDDPAVKSKLPMRWTFRQATGEVFWSILIASISPIAAFLFVNAGEQQGVVEDDGVGDEPGAFVP
jgi:hypothetical protein